MVIACQAQRPSNSMDTPYDVRSCRFIGPPHGSAGSPITARHPRVRNCHTARIFLHSSNCPCPGLHRITASARDERGSWSPLGTASLSGPSPDVIHKVALRRSGQQMQQAGYCLARHRKGTFDRLDAGRPPFHSAGQRQSASLLYTIDLSPDCPFIERSDAGPSDRLRWHGRVMLGLPWREAHPCACGASKAIMSPFLRPSAWAESG